MRQEEIDALLKKIEDSSEDVPMPEGLEPEQMMKKLQKASNNDKKNNKRNWKRYAEYGAVAAALLVTILAANQVQSAKLAIGPETGINEASGNQTDAAVPGETQAGVPLEEVDQTKTESSLSETGEEAADWEPEEAKQYIPSSYKELYQALKEFRQDNRNGLAGGAEYGLADGAMPKEEAMAGGTGSSQEKQDMAEDSASMKQNYSDTNVQVQGVDEGDIVKTDGTYIYMVSEDMGHIQILEANGGNPKKRGVVEDTSTAKESKAIQDFYLNGDRLSVIRQSYEQDDSYRTEKEDVAYNTIACYAYPTDGITYLETYDISDRDTPKLVGTVSQDGIYKNSRRVGDYIYLFTDYYAYDIQGQKKISSYVPSVNRKVLPYDCIYMPENITCPNYIVVTSINMKAPAKTVTQKAVLADGGQFYVSGENIYIGSTRYDGRAAQYDYTELLKLSYHEGTVTFKAHGIIDGYLNNQFSMDEYKGKLRVVTTLSYNNGKSTNSLQVLDESLKRIGEIEDLAPGEQIYSARFMGNTGYFVTFRNMDPLFSVDLTNPANPKVLGELKITGFSEYLHPYGNQLLLGIGREISPDTGNFKGLKLSMFDTSDPENVKEVQKMVERSYEYSPAWNNHKAVTVSSGKNLIGFAVEADDRTSRAWTKYYVVYSHDKKNGFKQELSFELDEDSDTGCVRGFYIGSWYYVVESGRVTAFDLNDFAKAGQMKF